MGWCSSASTRQALSGTVPARFLDGLTICLVELTGIPDVVGQPLGEVEPLRSTPGLATTFPNSGNFDLPVDGDRPATGPRAMATAKSAVDTPVPLVLQRAGIELALVL